MQPTYMLVRNNVRAEMPKIVLAHNIWISATENKIIPTFMLTMRVWSNQEVQGKKWTDAVRYNKLQMENENKTWRMWQY